MTVYEMIQELSQYDAGTEVEINAFADEYRATVEVNLTKIFLSLILMIIQNIRVRR